MNEQPTPDTDRLFVPLKTKHYRHFESGQKTWELRGINGQYNEKTVHEGRTVELRRGYSTDESLWGTITDVEVFGMISGVTYRIDYEKIVPGATHTEFLDSVAELLEQYDRYIAFRVELTNNSLHTDADRGEGVETDGGQRTDGRDRARIHELLRARIENGNSYTKASQLEPKCSMTVREVSKHLRELSELGVLEKWTSSSAGTVYRIDADTLREIETGGRQVRTDGGIEREEGDIEHRHNVSDVLTKVDSSEWKITNRMVDVDTEELLYRLHEMPHGGAFRETEILTESQVARSFDVESGSSTTGTNQSDEKIRTDGETDVNDRIRITSVDDAPICHGCGLISHHVHENTPLCVDCWQRRNWWQHQGVLRYVTTHGECRHKTPRCPAVQGRVYRMVRDEMVYLDTRNCERCDGYVLFDEFDWRATA